MSLSLVLNFFPYALRPSIHPFHRFDDTVDEVLESHDRTGDLLNGKYLFIAIPRDHPRSSLCLHDMFSISRQTHHMTCRRVGPFDQMFATDILQAPTMIFICPMTRPL